MIKAFNTKAEYNEFTSGGTRLESGILYYVKENGETHFATNNIDGNFKQYDMVSTVDYYRNQYCTIEPLEDGYFTLVTDKVYEIFYSKDNGATWEQLQHRVNVELKKGQNVLLKGNYINVGANRNTVMGVAGKFNLSGNLASISKGDNFRNNKTLLNRELCEIWGGNDTLISVKNLILDAEECGPDAYNALFYQCVNLVDSPVILAKKANELAFVGMFAECHNLVVPPDFSTITTVEYTTQIPLKSAQGSFYLCFQNCTSLKYPPKMPQLTTLSPWVYAQMFRGCTSLTTAPALPATTLAHGCYSGMFRDCTSLTTVPELPVTTLTDYDYQGLFMNCSSLTTAPELPAPSLGQNSYNAMFSGCKKINSVTAHFTEWVKEPANRVSIANWLRDVAPHGTLYIKNGVELPTDSISGIPTGWKVVRITD